MAEENRTYIAIDLKSFYASVECVERGLDALTTNLVVADSSKTEKTICLAVSPSLKAHGISGRARLFEVIQRVEQVNRTRLCNAPNRRFAAKSFDANELDRNKALELDYIIAPPQMSKYMEVSNKIYDIYLKYIAPEDMHVYSIDEVFIDATDYLKPYKLTAQQLAMKMIKDVFEQTGITATAGIGTNLFLCKVAMDILAKHSPADENGVRIASLDEESYRRLMWQHRPITDFWRIGKGYAKKLEDNGMFTMGDIARCSVGRGLEFHSEGLLYRLFGVNAELLIDHAWGYESCTIEDIKAYRPTNHSLSSGQVLTKPYTFEMGGLIVREMADLLSLELVEKKLVTDQMVLTVGYDVENLSDPNISRLYNGPVSTDVYGRRMPKSAHGSINLPAQVSSSRIITKAVSALYRRIADKNLLVRRITIAANNVIPEKYADTPKAVQLDLFTDLAALEKKQAEEKEKLDREKRIQQAVLSIKNRYGKNAILKGMNFEEGATTIQRNGQVGGHRA